MYELTNEQRRCFALKPVSAEWRRMKVRPGPQDDYELIAYVDGSKLVKCLLFNETRYDEWEISETLSEDGQYLLPKTAKGKPIPLSAPNLLKRTVIGMELVYNHKHICLFNNSTQRHYFSSDYVNSVFDSPEEENIDGFGKWVEQWCAETDKKDIREVEAFASQPRRHVKYKEGDVFRIKLGRRQYTYGRILLNYSKMRKEKQEFWDILMTNPLVCSVYHILTDDADVSVEKLKQLRSLPSCIMSDNVLYYGDYEVIGNIPVSDEEDYPIMYGNSISYLERDQGVVYFQQGKTYRRIENSKALYDGFRNNGIGCGLKFTVDILRKCIDTGSNGPYWEEYYSCHTERDLRNPKYKDQLEKIKKQMKGN